MTTDLINQQRDLIAELTAQRDNAWQELREVREAINVNPEESTADEVRRIAGQLVAVKQSGGTGQSPCAKFCESVALSKDFKRLEREKAELVAQVEALHNKLGKALDIAETGAVNNWYAEGEDICWINDELKEHQKGIPNATQHLNQIKADAVRGLLASNIGHGTSRGVVISADLIEQYAASIAKGE